MFELEIVLILLYFLEMVFRYSCEPCKAVVPDLYNTRIRFRFDSKFHLTSGSIWILIFNLLSEDVWVLMYSVIDVVGCWIILCSDTQPGKIPETKRVLIFCFNSKFCSNCTVICNDMILLWTKLFQIQLIWFKISHCTNQLYWDYDGCLNSIPLPVIKSYFYSFSRPVVQVALSRHRNHSAVRFCWSRPSISG